MPSPQNAQQVFDRQFLEMRCGLLNLAAALDRIERAKEFEAVRHDPRLALIRQAIAILGADGDDRAERVQMLFSDEYQPGWNASRAS